MLESNYNTVKSVSHRNNFNVLRIGLALLVYFYHLGALVFDERHFLRDVPGGGAVWCFFVISGYLITRSYLQTDSLSTFFFKRFIRIYPLYFVVILLSFFMGLVITPLSPINYLTDGGLSYLFGNIFFLDFVFPSLPGVFSVNNFPDVVNGSLWSIKVEVLLYIFVPIFYCIIRTNQFRIFGLTFLLLILFVINQKIIGMPQESIPYFIFKFNNQFVHTSQFFVVGSFIALIGMNGYDFPNKKKSIPLIVITLLIVAITFSYNFFYPIIVGMAVIYIAKYLPFKIDVPKKIGDISYGIYIIHFPLIQVFLHFNLFDNSFLGVTLCTLITLVFSWFSWNYFEKKMLKLKPRILILSSEKGRELSLDK